MDNYFTLAEGRWWSSTSAVDIDSDGTSIWVAERCAANSCAGSSLNPVLKLDASGRLTQRFGAGLFLFPNGIHVDRCAAGPGRSDNGRSVGQSTGLHRSYRHRLLRKIC